MKSIRWKLVFMYLTLVFIVMITSGTFIILTMERQEASKAEEELKQCATYIEEQIIAGQAEAEVFQDNLVNLFISSSAMRNMQGSILDSAGKTIASSAATDFSLFLEYKNSAVISALAGQDYFYANKQETDQNSRVKTWMSYATPVFAKNEAGEKTDKVEYIIYVQMDAQAINDSLSQTTKTIFISVILALILAAILGSLFANTITVPIAALTKKANLFAKGRLDQHVAVKSNDEIGQLTKSFNTMAKELRKTLMEMENQNNRLEVVLHNMTDGVLAFDERGVLIHANKICYDMLGTLNIARTDGKGISLNWFLNKINLSRESLTPDKVEEIVLNEGDKYINASLIPYSTNKKKIKGVVVVLQDITKHKLLDDMRKEFVANVSHEIGTPLTTIKGYTETLLDGALEDKEVAVTFLNEINEAANRMTFLRNDLLDLSRFDTRANKFNKLDINLVKLVEDSIRQNILVARNKNQEIVLKIPQEEKEMLIYADSGRINQVFTNILTNAIKYSPEETSIEIEVAERGNNFYVSVTDHGIGMSKEDTQRIFERFYRVDKARSRAMGGNGLGLAIAKEIMERHYGRIDVYSEIGSGTTMVLVFPKSHIAKELEANQEA